MEPAKMLIHSFIGLMLVVNYGSGLVYPSIQWEPNNPIFKTKNYTVDVILSSRIMLVCPNPTTVTDLMEPVPNTYEMYENIWIVDKSSYDACIVNTSNSNNKMIFRCDEPLKLNYRNIVFLMYTPLSNGLRFTPEKTYYLISTSNGFSKSLGKTSGGHCQSHNMRLAFHICKMNSRDCGKKIQRQKSC